MSNDILNGRFFYFLILISVFVHYSCEDNSEDDLPTKVESAYMYINKIEERFDVEGNIYVKASISKLDPDTIADYGIIYKDDVDKSFPIGYDDDVTKVSFKDSSPLFEHPDYEHFYSFEALINPERTSILRGSNHSVVNIAGYIVSNSGEIMITDTDWTTVAKPMITDLNVCYASAGTIITGELNRYVIDNQVWDRDRQGPGRGHDIFVIINGTEIPIEGYQKENYWGGRFYFTMPDGVKEETVVKIKIGDYESAYQYPCKNGSFKLELLTEYSRKFESGNVLIFAIDNDIYFGGGKQPGTINSTTDFWKYDTSIDTWEAIADYRIDGGGLGRGMSFVINGKAYCGQPSNLDRYDPILNSWQTVPDPVTSLRYDHTFANAATAVYNDIAYFTNFESEVRIGVYYHNFHKYNPATETYSVLPSFPGEDLESDYSDQAVALNDNIHFFPGTEHWVFDVVGNMWTQLTNIDISINHVKAFGYQNELYVIYGFERENSFGRIEKYLGILKYLPESDTWERDSDIPKISNFSDIYPVLSNSGKLYICMIGYDESRIVIYKVI